MSEPLKIEEVLLRELLRYIEPLTELGGDPDELTLPDPTGATDAFVDEAEEIHERFLDLLQDCGLEVPTLIATDGPVVILIKALKEVFTALKPLFDDIDNVDLTQAPTVFQEAKKAIKAVKDIADATQDFPEPDDIIQALCEHLFARYLERHHPGFQAMAGLLGVVDEDAILARERGQAAFGQISTALSDPLSALKETSGFGSEELDADRTLARLAQLLTALELPVQIGDARDAGLTEEEADSAPPGQMVFARIFESDSPVLEALLALRGMPSAGTEKPGFKLFVSGQGEGKKTLSIASDPPSTVTLSAKGEAGDLAGISLRPSGLSVDATLPDITLEAEYSRRFELLNAELGPLTLLGNDIVARQFLILKSEKLEVKTEAQIPKFTITIKPEGSDGFLASLLPSDGFSADIAPLVGWSSDSGFYLERGGTGLNVKLPVGMNFGEAFALTALGVGVGLVAGATPGLKLDLKNTADASFDIGPISGSVEGLGVGFDLDLQTANGLPEVKPGAFIPPTGLGLKIEAGPVKGGGYLSHDPDKGRYAGALALEIPPVAITAFGLLDTQMPDGRDGWSLLLFVSGKFPAIPLGFGFNLLGVGGLVGLNRDVDIDALFAAVRAGKAGQLLAPEDPIRDANALITQAEAIFPIKRGQHVFGPTVALGWGTPEQLFTLDLALALTLPEPLRLILIGTLRARIPTEALPVVKLNVDVAGVLDFSAARFDLEGRIYDSHIQGIPVAGGFAVRSCWGPQPELVFSVGGLHPAFEAPPGFPAIERLNTDLSKGSSFKLRIEGYFAVTSNALQFGAALDLQARAAGFAILAELGVDTLLIFDPFQLDVAIRASAAIKRGGRSLCAVRLTGRLTGPGPWRARGQATIEVLFFDVDVGFDTSFGEAARAPIKAKSAWEVLQKRLRDTRSWGSAAQGDAGDIVLDQTEGLLLPDAPLELRQDAIPLGLTLETFGGAPIAGARRFDVASVTDGAGRNLTLGDPTMARFSPGTFLNLSDDEKLSAPAFEEMEAGVALSAGLAVGANQPALQPRDLILIDAPDPEPGFETQRVTRRTENGAPDLGGLGPARKATPAKKISIKAESWVIPDADLSTADSAPGTYATLRGGARAPARMTEVGR